jgi:RyR domain
MSDDPVLERLARAVHEHYLAEQLADGAQLGQSAGMVSWHDLDDDKREASRDQARDIGAKLAQIGCVIVSQQEQPEPVAFSPVELEALAQREHRRWARQRRAAGWTYATDRDEAHKRHPSLVPWSQLSESEKDKDRDAVRNIGSILASAGLAVLRPAS